MKMFSLLSLAAVIGAISVATTQAQTQTPSLVFTEYSSTDLTAVWDGTTSLNVTLNGPDSWSIDTTIAFSGIGGWLEPDGSGDINSLIAFPNGSFVTSDAPNIGVGTPAANDTALPQGYFTYNFGPVDVTFNDLSDVAVPDAADALPLLGIALGALAIAQRRLRN